MLYLRSHIVPLLALLLVLVSFGHSSPPMPLTRLATTTLPDIQFPLKIRDTSIASCAGGYYACALSEGGGCCPTGYGCLSSECTSELTTTTATTTDTRLVCNPNWFQCESSLGGGCCADGQICGSQFCTFSITIASVATSAGSEVSTTLTETARAIQASPSIASTSITAITGPSVVTTAQVTTVTVAAAGHGGELTSAEVGGISGGAVVFVLILCVAGFILFRHLSRISRFLEKFEHKGEQSEIGKAGDNSTVRQHDSGPVGDFPEGREFEELSPQERSSQLDDWGRHRTLRTELAGSYGAHGVSELEGNGIWQHGQEGRT